MHSWVPGCPPDVNSFSFLIPSFVPSFFPFFPVSSSLLRLLLPPRWPLPASSAYCSCFFCPVGFLPLLPLFAAASSASSASTYFFPLVASSLFSCLLHPLLPPRWRLPVSSAYCPCFTCFFRLIGFFLLLPSCGLLLSLSLIVLPHCSSFFLFVLTSSLYLYLGLPPFKRRSSDSSAFLSSIFTSLFAFCHSVFSPNSIKPSCHLLFPFPYFLVCLFPFSLFPLIVFPQSFQHLSSVDVGRPNVHSARSSFATITSRHLPHTSPSSPPSLRRCLRLWRAFLRHISRPQPAPVCATGTSSGHSQRLRRSTGPSPASLAAANPDIPADSDRSLPDVPTSCAKGSPIPPMERQQAADPRLAFPSRRDPQSKRPPRRDCNSVCPRGNGPTGPRSFRRSPAHHVGSSGGVGQITLPPY